MQKAIHPFKTKLHRTRTYDIINTGTYIKPERINCNNK